MKRIVVVALLAFLGFYAAWPAWSGYRIRTAIETENVSLLEAKIEFPAVRTALKPLIAAELERTIAQALRDAGPLGGLIGGQLKGEVVGRMIDSAMNSLVTPANVIKIAHDGKNLREAVERVVKEQLGGLGGGLGGILGGRRSGGGNSEAQKDGQKPAGGLGGVLEKLGQRRPSGVDEPGRTPEAQAKPAPSAGPSGTEPGKRRFSLSNIKRFTINSPLSFSVGIARRPEATEPDVTAEMRFTGFDWKVVSLIPRLDVVTQ